MESKRALRANFVTYGLPFIDIDSGGSIDGMIDAVEKVIARMPPDVRIPGHGPSSTIADLETYLAMLKRTRNAVSVALQAGNTLDQMKRARILDLWKKYSGDFRQRRCVLGDALQLTAKLELAEFRAAASSKGNRYETGKCQSTDLNTRSILTSLPNLRV